WADGVVKQGRNLCDAIDTGVPLKATSSSKAKIRSLPALCARCEHQHGVVKTFSDIPSSVDRKPHHLVEISHSSYFCAFSINYRWRRFNIHRGRHLTHLQAKIDAQCSGGLKKDVRNENCLEPGKLSRGLVSPGIKVGHLIEPSFISDRVILDIRVYVPQGNRDARHGGTALISNQSANSPQSGLS